MGLISSFFFFLNYCVSAAWNKGLLLKECDISSCPLNPLLGIMGNVVLGTVWVWFVCSLDVLCTKSIFVF